MVLGHRTLEEYFGSNYQGTFVGRYANRIGGASFELNGKTYTLAKNDGNNTLHGGPGGYHQVLWTAETRMGRSLPSSLLTRVRTGMRVTRQFEAEGYLYLEEGQHAGSAVRCCLRPGNALNPTNHSFFNLSGDPQKDVLGTYLTINAKESTAVSDDLIPRERLFRCWAGLWTLPLPKSWETTCLPMTT